MFTIFLSFEIYRNYKMHAKKVKTRTNLKIALHLVDRFFGLSLVQQNHTRNIK